MFQLITTENIHKIGPLGYDDRSDSKAMNDPHEINQVDVVRIGNNNTCSSKNQQAEEAQPVPSKTVNNTADEQL